MSRCGDMVIRNYPHNPATSQTDGQTTCDRMTALCTVVHRAVKMPTAAHNTAVIRTLLEPTYAKGYSDKLNSSEVPQ